MLTVSGDGLTTPMTVHYDRNMPGFFRVLAAEKTTISRAWRARLPTHSRLSRPSEFVCVRQNLRPRHARPNGVRA